MTKTIKLDKDNFDKDKNGLVTPTGTVKRKCPCCGQWKAIGKNNSSSSFYKSSSKFFKYNDGMMVWCKDCVQEEYEKNFDKIGDIYAAIKSTCITFNIPLDDKTFDIVIKKFNNNGEIKKGSVKKVSAYNPFKEYMRLLNSLASNGNLGISNYTDDFDSLEIIKTVENVEADENKLSPKELLDHQIKTAKLTNDEEVSKKDCIDMLEQDPFVGCSIFDQKYLYKALIPYLDEDTLEDAFKLSQVLQIVNNNNQVRKIDLMINALSSDMKSMMGNQSDIKALTATKKQIVENTDKIAKENGISVKNRGDKKAGKSTLTYLMKNLRELNFEDAEADYYDQLICLGMQKAADASFSAIFSQLNFDENDWGIILKNNREILDKLYKEVDDLKEENRQLNVKITQLESVGEQ